MITLLLIATLAASDAPLAEQRPDGSVVFSAQGYANLKAETDRLQIVERRVAAAEQHVVELEASPRLTVPALVAIVTTCLTVGIVVGWRLKEMHP